MRRPVLLIGIGVIALALVGVTAVYIARERARASAGIVPCASNLRQIGQAVRQYAINTDGSYPSDLEMLAATFPELGLHVFVCPEHTGASAAPPPFVLGRNLSYVYLGAGLTDAASPAVPLAHCAPAHHGGDGTYVLFADGSVRYVTGDELRQLLAQR